jgi:hypothetical protein
LWIIYAVVTNQYGFIFAAVAYTLVYIKSFMSWKSEAESGTPKPPKAAEYNMDELW